MTFQQELESRQQKGLIDKDVLLLTVEDPKERVGSGGATLNALYVAAEHLGARLGQTIVTADILNNAHILIMNMGRNFPFDACGRAFSAVPMGHANSNDSDFLFCNLDLLLYAMSNQLAPEAPPGVWMCSTDMLLNIPKQLTRNDFEGKDFCIIATPANQKYARNHGALKLREDGTIMDIIYKGKPEVLSECTMSSGYIPIASGVVFLSSRMAERLLSMTVIPPLDACTYIGLDNGAHPIMLSIFFDFALSMCENLDEEAYVTGARSGVYGTDTKLLGDKGAMMKQARSLLWRDLHGNYSLKAIVAENGEHSYMDDSANTHYNHILLGNVLRHYDAPWDKKSVVHSEIAQDVSLPEPVTVINSKIEEGVQIGAKCIISHCHIRAGSRIPADCYLAGLEKEDRLSCSINSLSENLFVQAFRINIPLLGKTTPLRVMTVLGKYDNVTAPMWKGATTYCNTPWILFLNTTGKNIRYLF